MPADYPLTRPVKLIDFSNQEFVDSDFVFSRSTDASVVNASGLLTRVATNTPRIQYDPISGRRLGLLLEAQSTNLLPWSNDLSNPVWIYPASNGPLVSGYLGVGGTNSAFRISESTIPNFFYIATSTPVSNPSYIAPSAFVKSDGVRKGALQAITYASGNRVTGNAVVYFDLTRGTARAENYGTNTLSYILEPWKNGWYRVGCTGPTASGSVLAVTQLFLQNDDDGIFYAGSNRGLLVDGIQLEPFAATTSPMVSSFIFTSGVALTRGGDLLSSDTSRLSQWYSGGNQTMAIEAIVDNRDFIGAGYAGMALLNSETGARADIRFVANAAGATIQSLVSSGSTSYAIAFPLGNGLLPWELAASGIGSARAINAHVAFTFSSSGSFLAYNVTTTSGASGLTPSGVNRVEIGPVTCGKLLLRRASFYPELPSAQAVSLTIP